MYDVAVNYVELKIANVGWMTYGGVVFDLLTGTSLVPDSVITGG